ncbi:MAG TPA: glycosyl hydrolase [Phycisphaerae bacterium]|nr:glycosyl hydrolase [Phycisphaerae bacterium]
MAVTSSRVLAALTLACMTAGAMADNIEQLQQRFSHPPDDARPMVRWWWFGPAVTEEGIDRELQAMKAGGFGGVEVQPTYPLGLDGKNVHNLKYMSPEFLHMLGYTAARAKELGMRMDLTLGSGWPYGGPMFGAAEGAGRIETQVVRVKSEGQAGVLTLKPKLKAGYSVVAAFAGPAIAEEGGERGRRGTSNVDVSGMKQVPVESGAAKLPAGFDSGSVVFFIAGRTGMKVKRPAIGAEGNVIDHLSAAVVDKFIAEIAEPEIKACGANPPFAVFCDSLEVQGENWTDDFLAEFQKRRGYELTPYLPALIGNIGDKTDAVRYDFGRTVTELYSGNFNAKFKALAEKYGTRFRVQGYGSPPAGLVSYAYSNLPEGELQSNFDLHDFRATRYAASASHLMNVPVTSAETFTWLHTAPFRATPVDFKGEVDIHFLDGINQIICHGWPYTGNGASYPGWSFYAAAVVDDKNPWYVGMPAVTGYIQRMSALLREGMPVEDVALYLPDADVWAHAGTGFSSLNAAFTEQSPILAQVLNAGYNLDGWDDGMLELKGKVEGGALVFGGMKYRVVVLPAITHMPLETARKLEEFAKGGGTVIALKKPTVVPGVKATEADQKELAGIMDDIFSAGGRGILVADENGLAAALKKAIAPDVVIEGGNGEIGMVHRHTDAGEIYFLANRVNEKKHLRATFRVAGMYPELWNGLTGTVRNLPTRKGEPATVELDLDAYGSAVVAWTDRVLPGGVAPMSGTVDLSDDWDVSFQSGPGGEGKTVHMPKLTSWTEVGGMKNYSGVATYQKKFTVSADVANAGAALSLGATSAGSATARGGNGFMAEVTPPVLDVAVVYVNDKPVGTAWCPPYQVDLTGALKAGENTIRIEVGNTAVNYLSKAGFPNYDLKGIRSVYGNRFDPQGTQLYGQPLASGLLGPIQLVPAFAH